MDRLFLSDGNFTREEADRITEILGKRPEGKSQGAGEYLRQNQEEYASFAYEMGIAYFYYYNGEGNKLMSQPWFEAAMSGKQLDPVKKSRAERFYRIADYYSILSNRDRTGDSSISFRQYWDDLYALSSGNIAEDDNKVTALVMYKELLYQISMRASDFMRAGVSKAEMEKALYEVQDHMQHDFMDLNPASDTLFEEVEDLIPSAKNALETAYSGSPVNEQAEEAPNTSEGGAA